MGYPAFRRGPHSSFLICMRVGLVWNSHHERVCRSHLLCSRTARLPGGAAGAHLNENRSNCSGLPEPSRHVVHQSTGNGKRSNEQPATERSITRPLVGGCSNPPLTLTHGCVERWLSSARVGTLTWSATFWMMDHAAAISICRSHVQRYFVGGQDQCFRTCSVPSVCRLG